MSAELFTAMAKVPAFGVAWFPVSGSSQHFVSEEGEILSVTNRKPKLLVGSKAGDGYRFVRVAPGVRHYIHHLVCETFNGLRPEGCHARHLDGDKANNSYRNLAWGTPKQNAADKIAHGTNCSGERNPMAKLTRALVDKMRVMRASQGLSHAKIARLYGVSTMTAYRAIEGVSWND